MFTHLKSTLVNRELRTVSQDFITVVCWVKVSVYALWKYSLSSVKLHYANISLIVYSEMITFPCMNLICYLCIMITNHYHMYLIVKTHFVLCLLLS